MTIREVVSMNIMLYRKQFRLSQTQLAKLSGLTQKTISLLENNKREVGITTLYRISEAMNLDICKLFRDPTV